MRLLSIDTASAVGSLALLEDGRLVEELVIHEPQGFSPVLFGAIEQLLGRKGWVVASMDAFAGGAGPGSFTGVRVALSAVKGLAEALHRPAYAISNLAAAAHRASGSLRAPWLDARRGEIYGGVFRSDGSPLAPETVGPWESWRRSLPAEAEVFAADGWPLAAAIGELAYARWRVGDRPDNLTLDANYVRRADAELTSRLP